MLEQVLELAKSLHPVSGGPEVLLENLCRIACRRLDSRLREDAKAEEYADAYVTAAAWLALAGLNAGGRAEGVKKFSAGDLTIETEKGGAEGLEDKAWKLMEPYLKDSGFVFRGVQG